MENVLRVLVAALLLFGASTVLLILLGTYYVSG
jgi:hypothetical protein